MAPKELATRRGSTNAACGPGDVSSSSISIATCLSLVLAKVCDAGQDCSSLLYGREKDGAGRGLVMLCMHKCS